MPMNPTGQRTVVTVQHEVNATAVIPNQVFAVDSTALTFIAYDFNSRESHNRLTVVFRDSGKTWQYERVPQTTALMFLQSASHGSFYTSNIKGRFLGTEI